MRVIFMLFLSSAVILHSIELSSESPPEQVSDFSGRSPSPPERSKSKSRSRSKSPCHELTSAEPCSPGTASSSQPPPSAKSNDASTTRFIMKRSNYEYEYLKSVRLTSKRNPSRIFRLRKYTFPADTPIVLTDPTRTDLLKQEQTVVSTHEGEVFAILDGSSSRGCFGLYMYHAETGRNERVKVNVESGKPTFLTPDESNDTPVGTNGPVSRYFRVSHVDKE